LERSVDNDAERATLMDAWEPHAGTNHESRPALPSPEPGEKMDVEIIPIMSDNKAKTMQFKRARVAPPNK
jgi:hypothetical protein